MARCHMTIDHIDRMQLHELFIYANYRGSCNHDVNVYIPIPRRNGTEFGLLKLKPIQQNTIKCQMQWYEIRVVVIETEMKRYQIGSG